MSIKNVRVLLFPNSSNIDSNSLFEFLLLDSRTNSHTHGHTTLKLTAEKKAYLEMIVFSDEEILYNSMMRIILLHHCTLCSTAGDD